METKHLIKNTQDFQKFVRINQSVLQASFLPYELDARNKYLLPYIGKQLHDELIDLYNESQYPDWADDDTKKKILDNVLFCCQNALAKLTLYIAAPHLDLHLSEMGFVVSSTTNSAPASAQRVSAATQAFLSQGYDNIETLLLLLEDNHKVIDSYKDTQAYVLEFSNLINTAREFNQIIPMSISRLKFINLKSEMQTIKKLTIIPAVSSELFEQLVEEKKANTLTPPNKAILELLQKTMAYMALAQSLTLENTLGYLNPLHQPGANSPLSNSTVLQTKDRFHGYGLVYLAKAKKKLQNKPDDYPAYKTSAEFSELDRVVPYENNEEDRIFIFGQPSMD